MEEDIKIIQELIKDFKNDKRVIMSIKGLRREIEVRAIEHLIKEYKKKEKIIEQLETEKQNLIEKLERDIEKANEILTDQDYRYIEEVIDEQWFKKQYAQEILSYMKGEEK